MDNANLPTRSALRRHFRNARRALTPSAASKNAQLITEHLLALAEVEAAQTIATFVAFDGEPDLTTFAEACRALGKTTVLPRIVSDTEMSFHGVAGSDALEDNRFGIAEPSASVPEVMLSEIDVMLLPLVAFDARGTRLGMGAGYYDRALSKVAHRRPFLVGIAHTLQRSADPLPRETWDATLDAAVTEAGTHRFS